MIRAPREAGVLVVAAAAGAATMVIELAAVRLLAPWFGSSLAVWTNVISVVLLALAVGYFVGARLARSGNALGRMGWFLVLAAIWGAWIPALASPVGEWLMPEGVVLGEAADLIGWGSLAASLTLFFPAAALLGCISPLAVQAVADARHNGAGNAGGRVMGAGTLGSLVGSFATTHLLVPELGLSASFRLAAAVLFLSGVGVLVGSARSGSRAWAAAFVVGALLGGSSVRAPLTLPSLPDGWSLLAAVESPYQSVRVVEAPEGMRFLQVNEITDSYQSAWQPEPGLLPEGFYYNYFALPAWWGAEVDGPWHTAVLGLGAGTAWRVLEGALPDGLGHVSTGVELDPEVVRLSRRHLDMPDDVGSEAVPPLVVAAGLDARVSLRALPDGAHDQILLDAYANQVEIPPHLCTLEFFREVRAKLGEGGWLSINVSAFGPEDPVLAGLTSTVAAAFERDPVALRVPASRNWMVFVRRDADVPPVARLLERTAGSPLHAFVAPAGLASNVLRTSPDEPVWTDDRNDVELRQRASIRLAEAARL